MTIWKTATILLKVVLLREIFQEIISVVFNPGAHWKKTFNDGKSENVNVA